MPFKSQSAMEYLMTYGWAILIIAIVMIALFQLGLFGGIISSRATAGACQIYKSVAGSSLAGQCGNEWPKFVAHFNGINSVVTVTAVSSLQPNTLVSISSWIYLPGNVLSGASDEGIVQTTGLSYGYDLDARTSSQKVWFYINGGGFNVKSGVIPASIWNNIIATYNGVALDIYVNGLLQGTTSYTSTIASPNILYIGLSPGNEYLNGSVSNVQVYNTSLSQSEITALYQEGIGGSPIDPTHIVGWWPLNGNAQDYSGNNNQGTATAVSYNSSWTSGYVQP